MNRTFAAKQKSPAISAVSLLLYMLYILAILIKNLCELALLSLYIDRSYIGHMIEVTGKILIITRR
jgi:hypothetical protein